LGTPNDYHAVNCSTYREILSAALDGEAGDLEHDAATHHLATCTACSTWFESAVAVTRSARLSPAEAVPDLTAAILMAAPGPAPVDGLPVARVGLALVALAQLLIGVVSLLDASGIAAHLSREQGVWELALAIGFATAAWQPRRATGLVPLVTALVAGLLVTGSIDAADGSVAMLGEGHHLIALVGLTLLFASTRLSGAPRRLVAR
jgi:predicted anti-sigma-YlaC factor YlaD